MKKIVVIGGGHGSAKIARGLKKYPDVETTFIISVADNGGSTGKLRKMYNIPAMGDIRNVMIALSEDENIFTQLMDYRFEMIDNHNLGNLVIAALSNITNNFNESIKLLAKILRIKGDIYPSTDEIVDIYARMDDDTIVKGEANIPSFTHQIKEIFYDHQIEASKEAVDAIMEADLVVYGIGSLYTSIIPNTIIDGIHQALNKTKALKIYFCNCMTQSNETFNYEVKDHVDALIKHGGVIDYVITHSDKIPSKILDKYIKMDQQEVIEKTKIKQRILRYELLEFDNDLIRHNSDKIAKAIMEIMDNNVIFN